MTTIPPTNLCPPATPTMVTKVWQTLWVHLPIHGFKQDMPKPTPAPQDLIMWLSRPPYPWAESLWDHIWPFAHMSALLHLVQAKHHILICSIASADADGTVAVLGLSTASNIYAKAKILFLEQCKIHMLANQKYLAFLQPFFCNIASTISQESCFSKWLVWLYIVTTKV